MSAAREEMEADPHVQHVRRLLGYADLDALDFDTLVAIAMLASSMRDALAEIEQLRADIKRTTADLNHARATAADIARKGFARVARHDAAYAWGAADMRERAAEVARGCATKTLDDGGHDIADAMAHGIADSIEALAVGMALRTAAEALAEREDVSPASLCHCGSAACGGLCGLDDEDGMSR